MTIDASLRKSNFVIIVYNLCIKSGPSTEGDGDKLSPSWARGESLPPPPAGKINPLTLYHRVVKY